MKTVKALFYGAAQPCLLLLFLGSTSLAGEKGIIEVKSINRVSERVSHVDLVAKDMGSMTGTTSQVLDVDFTLTENRCGFTKTRDGRTNEKELTLWCYELRGKVAPIPNFRAVWTFRPVTGFRLFFNVHGKTYLAWVDSTAVCIEDISQSKQISEALISYMSKSERYMVPVTDLAGRKPFEGLDAIHSDIDIVSVNEDESGRLRLIVQAPKTGQLFEFVFDGKNWMNAEK